MVPQIDFLPATYHVQRQQQHTTLWRRMMVFFFLALAMLGTWQQRRICRKLEIRRDELQLQAQGFTQALPVETQLEQRLREIDQQTQLLTALELRAPMSRVLSAVTRSLPEFVSLSEFQAELALKELKTAAQAAASPGTATDKSKLAPMELDLTELRTAEDRLALFITLHGLAPDDFALSRYLISLRETELFDRVTLTYTGQHKLRDESLRSFQLRLQVRRPRTWIESAARADRPIAKIAPVERTPTSVRSDVGVRPTRGPSAGESLIAKGAQP